MINFELYMLWKVVKKQKQQATMSEDLSILRENIFKLKITAVCIYNV